MKVFFILLILLWIPGGTVAQNSENGDGLVFHFGVSSNSFDNINRNDAIAALRAWTEAIIKEQKLKEKAEVSFYGSFKELSSAYRNNSVDAVGLTVEESIRLGVEPEFVYLPSREDGFHVSYAILVHRSNDIRDVAKLAGKKIVSYEGQRMLLARLWLKSVLAEHAPGTGGSRLENLTSVDNPSKAILQIFFLQSDAAIVTTDAFELACELNPQLRKDIKVLSTSPPFFTSFFIFRPTWQGPSRERVESAIMALHTTPGGQQVLNVFQSSRMEKHPGSILDGTRQFLIKNQQLIQNTPFK